MEYILSSALLFIWVFSAWMPLSGSVEKPVSYMIGIVVADIVYVTYLIAAQGGLDL